MTHPVGLDRLDQMMGGKLLVRVTYLKADETVERIAEFVGVVTSVDPLVVVDRPGHEQFTLPAEPSAFEVAAPGRYRLHSTGEIVNDPHYTTIWTVRSPASRHQHGHPVKRVLQFALWPFRDPVVLLTAGGTCGLVILILANMSPSNPLHSAIQVGGAISFVGFAQATALRRRTRGRRYSVEPPPDSRPAEALARHRAANDS